jgi:hypothetical protein
MRRVLAFVRTHRITVSQALLTVAVAALTLAGPAQARSAHKRSRSSAKPGMAAPRLQTPDADASVQSLPAFSWSSVPGAVQYEFEFSADRKFTAGVNGFGQPDSRLKNTAITDDKTVADGIYFWRVRGISSADHPGPWSGVRALHKAWTFAPAPLSPINAVTVNWPAEPLILNWSPVPYAVGYNVLVATDQGMSNLVVGSADSPLKSQGTQAAITAPLAPGTYYWSATPLDAQGSKGRPSPVRSFNWVWPSGTTVSQGNANVTPGVFDPQFSWQPVGGAASYQLELNTSPNFTSGSKLCCNDSIVGTTFTPAQLLSNTTTLYWRMRAIDVRGDAGDWNVGQPFTEPFDNINPQAVPGLSLVDDHGNAIAAGTATKDPIIAWQPVPGASSYEVQMTPYDGIGCDFTKRKLDEHTAATYWTPTLGGNNQWEPQGWPGPEQSTSDLSWTSGSGVSWCFRVNARRDDGPLGGDQVISNWTSLGAQNSPAFSYMTPDSQAPAANETPAAAYILPAAASTSVRTPLFTWNPVAGANGYYVVISLDQNFTDVVDIGYSITTAYAPKVSFPDATSAYYWALIPATNASSSRDQGTGVYTNPQPQNGGQDHPQPFSKSSVPPTPSSPTNGAGVQTQATFAWTSAEAARSYQLQVAGDPSFANPLEQVTTTSTSYTSEHTLPADKTLFWRVRANDLNGNGFRWSAVSTFTHHLPAPTPAPGQATVGNIPPVLSWTPVSGATSYDIHIDAAPGGSAHGGSSDSTSATFEYLYGPGIFRWQVRANFPGGASSSYFSPEVEFVHTMPPPSGVHATKSGSRILITWLPDSDAKQYRVELSTTDGFGSNVASDTTDNTSWVPQIDAPTSAKTLFWRLAIVDQGGNVGAYTTGVFRAPPKPKHHKPAKKRGKKKHK